jgi:lipopolysaccharide transport system ATP-binding protein
VLEPAGTRVGLWGTFDLENFGDHLFPLITTHELERRLGDVDIHLYSPFGWLHPTRLDSGEPAEPFGVWSEQRCEQLASELDAVLVGGGEIIHTRDNLLAPAYGVQPEDLTSAPPSRFFIEGLGPENELACPVVWHGVGVPFDPSPPEAARLRAALGKREYVTVRDELSLGRVAGVGADADVVVVPDQGFVLPRVFPAPVLDRRLRYLRTMGWYPGGEEKVLVVQGNRDLVRFAPAVVRAVERFLAEHSHWCVVLAEIGVCHGDGEFADTVAELLVGRSGGSVPVRRLPAEAGLEDTAAAIAHANAFLGISLHGCIAAFAFDRPFVAMNLNGQSKLTGLGGMVERPAQVVDSSEAINGALGVALGARSSQATLSRLQARVDEHFDNVARIIATSAASRRDDAGRGLPSPLLAPDWMNARLRAYREAHRVKSTQLGADRLLFADHVQVLRRQVAELQAQITELEQAVHERALTAEHDAQELARLRATKTFRYLAPLRRVYGRLLG